ncbi:MAG: hypothetical protein LC769_09540 [Chloroflexi bacterium]|nr:hypothetical protein [Chloroflexota bacterium]
MVQQHDSTAARRAQVVCQMIAHAGEYGFVTQLSRQLGISRQTLYTWTERGSQALEHVFRSVPAAPTGTPALERAILTLLVEGHASVRGIQACLRATTGQQVSVGTIVAVLAEAEARAVAWMSSHAPPTSRALALDEIYGRKRRGAYLNVVDLDSWAVWAAEGPLPVDAETWTLVLWEAQARGLRWHATVSDGAPAMQQACATVDPAGQHGRDVWHLLHTCSQIQARVERVVHTLEDQVAAGQRYTIKVAAGERPRGRRWRWSCCGRWGCWMRPPGRPTSTCCWACWLKYGTGRPPAKPRTCAACTPRSRGHSRPRWHLWSAWSGCSRRCAAWWATQPWC